MAPDRSLAVPSPARGAALAIAAALLIAIGTLPFALALSAPLPRVGEAVLVVFSPLATPDRAVSAVARAGGELVGSTAVPWIVIAISREAQFGARLGAEGALLVRAARGVLACLGQPLTPDTTR